MALLLARYMQGEPRIVRVHYPGLPPNDDGDDPQQFVIAEQQMPYGMFGGVLSIELATETEAMALAGAVMVLQRAFSLGGTETLIETSRQHRTRWVTDQSGGIASHLGRLGRSGRLVGGPAKCVAHHGGGMLSRRIQMKVLKYGDCGLPC
jgi:cystathionine beta-lyase/cystathionine gamma-synthase